MSDISQKPNFKMPAEWEHHKSIWIAWPHDKTAFPKIEKVEKDVASIINAVHESEQVELIVLDEQMKTKATEILDSLGVNLSKVNFRIAKYLGGWMRDCAGIFVRNNAGGLELIDWGFNTWGNKFPELQIDENLPKKIAEWAKTEIVEPGMILEGGSIEVNGEGLLLTTEQCLLNPNRNPGFTKDQIEEKLRKYLGINKIIWLERGLANDHTDGHIDDIVKFVSPNKILCAYEENESDPNCQILKDNYEFLKNETDANGNRFEVLKLPMPSLYYDEHKPFENGEKAPASYANFYIGNNVVLIPAYQDKNDAKAKEIIQACFPDKKIVQIDCRDLIYGGGAIHCLTQQQPL